MHRILYLICFWAVFSAGLSPAMAANYTIQGQLNAGQANVPIDAVEVILVALPLGQETVIYTEPDGSYSATIEIPGEEEVQFLVAALDVCTDQINAQLVSVAPDATATLDFTICIEGSNSSPCECGTEVEEVCVEVSPGIIIPFINICEAECAGFDSSQFVICDFHPPVDTSFCDCEFELDPVCILIDSTEVLTFANACFAACEGFTADQYFSCDSLDHGPVNCECEGDQGPEICVWIDYAGVYIPFPNACEAECAGFDATYFVDCEEEDPNEHPNECDCPLDGEVVCVVGEHGSLLQYPNACWAECDGYSIDDLVECSPYQNDCNCVSDSIPVCVEFVLGAIVSFPSACDAICYGFDPIDFVDCEELEAPVDCDCPNEGEEVCVMTGYGFILHFPNACEAECEGYTELDFVDCANDPYNCGCEPDGLPVCIQIAPGIIITFPSACDANCFGFVAADFVDCETGENPNDCGCEAGGNPVCVFIDSTTSVQFPNLCEAECAGYHADSFIDCDPFDEHPSPCGCEAENDPVCVEVFPGYVIPLPSVCDVFCYGLDSTNIVDCNDIGNPYDCECPFDGEPVCVQITPELIVLFPNECTAECGGYTDFVDCDSEQEEEPAANCGCEEIADPVCVEVNPGVIIPFLNACSAECAGFDASQFVDCGAGLVHNNVFTHSYAEPGERSGIRSSEVSPNPAFDLIQVRTDWSVETEAEIQIVSMNGQLMKSLRYGTAEGPQQWTISIDELPSGLYLLQIISAEGQRVEKFVKQ